jgi:hypothetical protein
MKRAAAQDQNFQKVIEPGSSWWRGVMDEVHMCLLWFGEAGATTEQLCAQTLRERNTVAPAVVWLKRDGKAFHSGRVKRGGKRHGVVWVAKREWVTAQPEQLTMF